VNVVVPGATSGLSAVSDPLAVPR